MIQPRHRNKQMITSFEPVHTLSSVDVPGSVWVSGPASTVESHSTCFLLLDFDGGLGSKGVIEAAASGWVWEKGERSHWGWVGVVVSLVWSPGSDDMSSLSKRVSVGWSPGSDDMSSLSSKRVSVGMVWASSMVRQEEYQGLSLVKRCGSLRRCWRYYGRRCPVDLSLAKKEKLSYLQLRAIGVTS